MELMTLYFSESVFRFIIIAAISGVGLTLLFLIGTLIKESLSKNLW